MNLVRVITKVIIFVQGSILDNGQLKSRFLLNFGTKKQVVFDTT